MVPGTPGAHGVLAPSPLTKVKLINELNAREAELGVQEAVSWHAEYKDSAWVFVGTGGGGGKGGGEAAVAALRSQSRSPSRSLILLPVPVPVPVPQRHCSPRRWAALRADGGGCDLRVLTVSASAPAPQRWGPARAAARGAHGVFQVRGGGEHQSGAGQEDWEVQRLLLPVL